MPTTDHFPGSADAALILILVGGVIAIAASVISIYLCQRILGVVHVGHLASTTNELRRRTYRMTVSDYRQRQITDLTTIVIGALIIVLLYLYPDDATHAECVFYAVGYVVGAAAALVRLRFTARDWSDTRWMDAR